MVGTWIYVEITLRNYLGLCLFIVELSFKYREKWPNHLSGPVKLEPLSMNPATYHESVQCTVIDISISFNPYTAGG